MDTDRFLTLLRSLAALPKDGAADETTPTASSEGKPVAKPEVTPDATPANETRDDERDDEAARPRSAAATAVRPAPARPTPDVLPPWRVLLHNDDHNDMDHVVESIMRVVRLNRPSATRCMVEAHRKGCCQVVATHREKAEFLAEQLRSYRLTVTIEPVR